MLAPRFSWLRYMGACPMSTNGTDVGAVRDDVLLDRGSENDVTEEMDFEGTSADGRGRSAPRPLTARDTTRARKQVGG